MRKFHPLYVFLALFLLFPAQEVLAQSEAESPRVLVLQSKAKAKRSFEVREGTKVTLFEKDSDEKVKGRLESVGQDSIWVNQEAYALKDLQEIRAKRARKGYLISTGVLSFLGLASGGLGGLVTWVAIEMMNSGDLGGVLVGIFFFAIGVVILSVAVLFIIIGLIPLLVGFAFKKKFSAEKWSFSTAPYMSPKEKREAKRRAKGK